MKFVLSSYGTRGEVEPCVAVGRELLRRGHEVRMAVPPDLVGFVESAGLAAVAYKLDSRQYSRRTSTCGSTLFLRNLWRIRGLIKLLRELGSPLLNAFGETSTTLKSLADGADLLFTGVNFQEPAANVAEYYDIPLATLHYFPIRANGQIVRMRAVAVGSLGDDGDRVAVLADDEESRRGTAQ